MLDHYEENDIALEDGDASVDRVLERTMERVQQRPRSRTRRWAGIAAACAAVALLGCTAVAHIGGWNGFRLSSSLTKSERTEVLEAAKTGLAAESVDAATGEVTLYDREGNVTAVMTQEEYAARQQQASENHTAELQASTSHLDISELFPICPNSITELEIGEDGAIPDILLGNGALVLLKQAGDAGWTLKAGDQVTISVHGNAPCNFEFYLISGEQIVEETHISRTLPGSFEEDPASADPTGTFTIPADGEYYFMLGYFSAAADEFTDGVVSIAQS